MSKVKCIGIIAEDNSDYESAKKIIKRLANKQNLPFKKAIGNGCGKIKRKASDYAVDLKRRGCDMLIFLHDLDRNNYEKLKADLDTRLDNSPIKRRLVCIPVEEIEAWFLSDPEGLKSTFKLKRRPNIKREPEKVLSPKEKLEELIYTCSHKNTIYLNTKHNQVLAENISLDLMKKKCKSFRLLSDFISKYEY